MPLGSARGKSWLLQQVKFCGVAGVETNGRKFTLNGSYGGMKSSVVFMKFLRIIDFSQIYNSDNENNPSESYGMILMEDE